MIEFDPKQKQTNTEIKERSGDREGKKGKYQRELVDIFFL